MLLLGVLVLVFGSFVPFNVDLSCAIGRLVLDVFWVFGIC